MNVKPISRRTVLRGAGALLGLPLLEAMLPLPVFAQRTKSTNPRPRMICCYVPNGVNQQEWKPTGSGSKWKLSPSLEMLKEFKSDINVLSGLCHPKSEGGHSGADTWLTGADLDGAPGKDYQNSISVDQLAADRHGRETRFPSLELSFNGGTGVGRHRIGTPLPTESSPQRLFDRLFAPEDDAARKAVLRRHAEQTSVLDDVLAEAKALSGRLGASDRRKLDEYLGSVRETERRVNAMRRWLDVPKPEVSAREFQLAAQPNRHDGPSWLDVMMDLCCLALQTDTTRIITFQWVREAFGFAANGDDHHAVSHHGGDANMLAQVAQIDRFHLGKLARLLGKLKSTEEKGGTALDHTLVLFGSGIGDGNSHTKENLPLVLAGGRKLGLQQGLHLDFSQTSTPMANLLLTMLQAMGVSQRSFSDSTEPLSGLT